MPEQKGEPYPLEPEDEHTRGQGPEGEERKGKLDAPGFLSEFPEDADFDRDPDVERAVKGPAKAEMPPERASEREELVKTGFGEARTWAIAGAVLLVSAMVATAINAPERTVARTFLTLYNTLVHTGTGVVALFIAAQLTERRLGMFELAGARMFTAVAAFALIFNLNINLIGEGWEGWKGEELVLGAIAYVGLVAVSFRMWEWRTLFFVAASHFLLWLVVYIGMQLAALARVPV